MKIALARASLGCVLVAGLGGCATRPPTLAHVHIGHAVTGVHVTPGHKGYVLVAQQRAQEAATAAQTAAEALDLEHLKSGVTAAAAASDSESDFGVKQSVRLAANHIAFAATSPDASRNVIEFAPHFKADTAAVLARCDYITDLSKDVAGAQSMHEASLLAVEIAKAARANLEGGQSPQGMGAVPADYGVAQLSAELQAMIGRENPPYRTVDEWYLFNLVRLPNGNWVFDKLGRGGNVGGYK